MSTILIKDSLRQSVEAASGGLQTVLYTAKGQPTFMNIIEKYDLSSIDPSLSGTHPAFIVDGVTKDKIFVGTYGATLKNGELLSLPNTEPTNGATYANLIAAAKSNGSGHHVMTNTEWAAVALLTVKDNNASKLIGNTYYGRSNGDATQYGRRVDGLSATAGITTGNAKILTGSGPVSFRHNQRYNGISDLVGNLHEFYTGFRLVNSEIQVIENNNAASGDALSTSTAWRAIHAQTGELLVPDGLGTTANSVRIAPSGTAANTLVILSFASFWSMTNPSSTPVSTAALNKLKALGLFPIASTSTLLGSGLFGFSTSNTTYPIHGGAFREGDARGLFQVNINYPFNATGSDIGTRTAYYTP